METVSIREQWEGRVAAGKFPLLEFLGGSADRGVFLTVLEGAQKAAIKLIPEEGPDADLRLAQWEKVTKLSHPHLMKIFESGRCVIDEANLIYVVTERAETDLAHVTPNKALDDDEAANIFQPVIEALLHLHRSEIIHGHVKLSNVLLVSGRAKLSSDNLLVVGEVTRPVCQPGNYDAPEVLNGRPSAAADTWSLGMTLAEAITRQLPTWDWSGTGEPAVPESLPEPYLEIVRQCLRLSPSDRCTLRSVLGRLEARKQAGGPSAPAANGNQLAQTTLSPPSPEVPFSSAYRAARFTSLEQSDPVPIKEAPVPATPPSSPDLTANRPPAPAPTAEKGSAAAAGRSASFGANRPASKWDFEPEPMPQLFTHLEASETRPFPIFRVIVGIVILLAVGGVLFVGIPKDNVEALLARLNVRSSSHEARRPSSPAQPAGDTGQSPSLSQEPAAPAGEAPPQPHATQPQPTATSPTPPASSPNTPPASGQSASPSQPAAGPGSSTGAPQPAPLAGSQSSPSGDSGAEPVRPAPRSRPQPQAPAPPPAANAEGAVTSRVAPSVSTAAREGMERPISVTLRVFVNREGSVSEVAYLSSGPGNYFARSAYRAAKSWKFSPPMRHGAPQSSQWTLHFYFSRGTTDIDATQQSRLTPEH